MKRSLIILLAGVLLLGGCTAKPSLQVVKEPAFDVSHESEEVLVSQDTAEPEKTDANEILPDKEKELEMPSSQVVKAEADPPEPESSEEIRKESSPTPAAGEAESGEIPEEDSQEEDDREEEPESSVQENKEKAPEPSPEPKQEPESKPEAEETDPEPVQNEQEGKPEKKEPEPEQGQKEESKPEAKQEEASEPEPSPSFDIEYWISYAKQAATAKGLSLNASATDCWDNPIRANADCKYLERDINSRMERYASGGEFTEVWVWYESIGDGSYLIYVGYA